MSQEYAEIIDGQESLVAKPKDSLRYELKIRNSLIEQGVDKKVADAVIGYRPQNVPFIYKSGPNEVLHHRVRDNWTEGAELIPGQSSLWIGTTDAIYNLANANGWNDQIPEIIVQWRGSAISESQQQAARVEISRTEVKPLDDGRFVEVEYTGISQMGGFDGEISQIALHVPSEKFRPGGASERHSYRIYYFKKHRKPNLEGVPGGLLPGKEEEVYEWTLDTSHSNVSGSTILNGFQEILSFNMAKIAPVKEDFSKAHRFTPLAESAVSQLLPASPEDQFQQIIDEETAVTRDRVLEVATDAEMLMRVIAPQALDRLAQGKYLRQTAEMQINGILEHPDKIWIFDRILDQFSREQRFNLARVVALATEEGHFTKWAQTLQEAGGERLVNDVVNRSTRHLLIWFKTKAPADADFKGWIAKAQSAADRVAGGAKAESPEYERVFDGMVTSFGERFLEYMGQQYLGNALV